MGLPEVHITFQENSQNFILRLGRGVVAVPMVDAAFNTAVVAEAANEMAVTQAVEAIPEGKKDTVSTTMKAALSSGAKKVYVVGGKDAEAVEAELSKLRFNWLAIAELDKTVQTAFVTWAKSVDFTAGRAFIVMGGAELASEKNGHVVAIDKEKSTAASVTSAALAGLFAALSARSGTFAVVDADTDGTGYASRAEADALVDNGVLAVFYDGEKAKIARAVTTAYAENKKSAYGKIRNVDLMNMIVDDIKTSFYDQYVGQVLNSYDNKMSFIGQLNQVYLKGLEGTVLDPSGVNQVDIDVAKHAELAAQEGHDVSEMSNQELREFNTDAAVYLTGSVKLLDSMEDLTITFVI